MELKEFVKGVIFDVTTAIKECQEEINNGAIISPTNNKAEERAQTYMGDLKISYIDFDVAVMAGSEIKESNGIGGSISVFSCFIGGKTGEENRQESGNISKVKFSIPVIYPSIKPPKEKPKIDYT